MLEYLSDALWEDILLRLPHTTLVQLAYVSKAWLSFIIRPSFIHQYSLSNPTPPLLLIHTPSRWALFNILPFPSHVTPILRPPYPSSFRFVESLNGIVCLIEESCDQDRAIVLWNPSVRRHLRLQIRFPNHSAIGFGFDSNNHDFKVIRFFNPRVELYSLNEGSWRVIYSSIDVKQFAGTSCFLNGNMHWIVAPCYPHKGNCVLIFNVGEEKFKNMELPPELVYVLLLALKVTVIGGCLSVLRYNFMHCRPSLRSSCDIWKMREYGVVDSWTKIRTVNLNGGGPVFGLSTSGNVLAQPVNRFQKELGSPLYFDTKSGEITGLNIHGSLITACEYTQSLVLLDRKRDGIFCTDYYSCPRLSRTSTTPHPQREKERGEPLTLALKEKETQVGGSTGDPKISSEIREEIRDKYKARELSKWGSSSLMPHSEINKGNMRSSSSLRTPNALICGTHSNLCPPNDLNPTSSNNCQVIALKPWDEASYPPLATSKPREPTHITPNLSTAPQGIQFKNPNLEDKVALNGPSNDRHSVLMGGPTLEPNIKRKREAPVWMKDYISK